MRAFVNRILVPTDFSPTADRALEYARALAERIGTSLLLLHVIEDPLVIEGLVAETYLAATPSLKAALLTEAQAQLGQRTKAGDRSEVLFGHGASAITDYALNHAIDLIVMGTHGRTGLAHLIIGSVAERVVRTASCPVLTVRHAGAAAHRGETAAEVAALRPTE
jgi:nucleotide-binding universal stress UspA family protein